MVVIVFLMVLTSACMNFKGNNSGADSSGASVDETEYASETSTASQDELSGEIQKPDYVSYGELLSLLGTTGGNKVNAQSVNRTDRNEMEKISDLASCVIDIGKFGFPRLIDKADLLNQEERKRFYDQIDTAFSQLERLDSGFQITATLNPEIVNAYKDKVVRLSVYDANGNVVAVSEYLRLEKETLAFSPIGFSEFLRGVFCTITIFEKETVLERIWTGRVYKPIKALLFRGEDRLLLY